MVSSPAIVARAWLSLREQLSDKHDNEDELYLRQYTATNQQPHQQRGNVE